MYNHNSMSYHNFSYLPSCDKVPLYHRMIKCSMFVEWGRVVVYQFVTPYSVRKWGIINELPYECTIKKSVTTYVVFFICKYCYCDNVQDNTSLVVCYSTSFLIAFMSTCPL